MVNSHSRTNGLADRAGYLNKLPLRRNAFGVVSQSDLRRSAALLGVSLAIMLLLGYLMGSPVPVPSPFAVDGDFSEWKGGPLYDDPADVGPGEVDLLLYGVHGTNGQIFVYGNTRTPLFPSASPTSVYVVIDSSAAPGYQAPGIEADFLAELWGWDNVVSNTVLREWTGSADRDNASSFRAVGQFPAIALGNEFELAIREDALGIDTLQDVRIVLVARSDDVVDLGATVGLTPGALLVEQRPLTNLVTAVAPALELRMRALAADVRVDGITVQQNGGGTIALPSFPFTVAAGSEHVETLSYDPGSIAPGSFVSVRIIGVTAVLPGGARPIPVTISGDDARFYVLGRPGGRIVDGLFDDWANVTLDSDNNTPPPAVNIWESAAAFPGSPFFYVRTEGRVFSGAILPERRNKAVQTAGNVTPSPPAPLRREAGEDVLRIYVDTDDRDSSGVPFGGLTADRWVEVRGRLGRITSTSLYAWNPSAGSWDRRTDAFNIAFVGAQLEASTSPSFLGSVNNPRVVFAMSDWSGRRDLSDVLGPLGTFAALAPPQPLHGVSPDNIAAPPLLNILPPVVDGRCPTTLGEYAGAARGSTFGFNFSVGRRDDTQHVYICIETEDTTNNFNDFAEIVFDTKHDGGGAPQPDDRLFWIFTNDNFIGMLEGDGVTWVSCVFVCDPSNAAEGRFRGTRQQYEFRIRYSDVWGTNSPPDFDVAGFAVFVWDDDGLGQAFGWGSAFLNDAVPDTWGHIIIPEFPIAAMAAGTAVVPLALIGRSRTRRRRVQR